MAANGRTLRLQPPPNMHHQFQNKIKLFKFFLYSNYQNFQFNVEILLKYLAHDFDFDCDGSVFDLR